ncbi:MAG: TIGR03032 family protein [Nannocystis sp.]|nr:TIGR03032 family protein [Nannocystis sp.]
MSATAFDLTASPGLPAWLAEQRLSLAFTTYQAGKLFLLGLTEDHQLAVHERSFSRCMGLHAAAQTLWLATHYQLTRLENYLPPGQRHHGHDRLYVPTVSHTTGDLDVHDVAVDGQGRPIFVNTLFTCLATVSEAHSFRPLWRPPWITRLAPEDRSHLNGLAMEAGRPAYVTAVADSDVADGWRDRRRDGGVLLDLTTDRILTSGLAMPHSPRLHRGHLYLLEAGTGYFCRVDRQTGAVERLHFCPGYARGLAFVGDYALIGLSALRQGGTFAGLELEANLQRHGAGARCGLLILDLRHGHLAHWIRLSGLITELYDVAILPGVRRPMAIGHKTDEIHHILTLAPDP